jgi:hypothetical protein
MSQPLRPLAGTFEYAVVARELVKEHPDAATRTRWRVEVCQICGRLGAWAGMFAARGRRQNRAGFHCGLHGRDDKAISWACWLFPERYCAVCAIGIGRRDKDDPRLCEACEFVWTEPLPHPLSLAACRAVAAETPGPSELHLLVETFFRLDAPDGPWHVRPRWPD